MSPSISHTSVCVLRRVRSRYVVAYTSSRDLSWRSPESPITQMRTGSAAASRAGGAVSEVVVRGRRPRAPGWAIRLDGVVVGRVAGWSPVQTDLRVLAPVQPVGDGSVSRPRVRLPVARPVPDDAVSREVRAPACTTMPLDGVFRLQVRSARQDERPRLRTQLSVQLAGRSSRSELVGRRAGGPPRRARSGRSADEQVRGPRTSCRRRWSRSAAV